MLQYDLKVEVASFIIVSIVLLNILWDKELDSRRNRIFKSIVIASFCSITTTLISTYTSIHVKSFPLWITELFKVLYYIFLPGGAVVVFFYALSLKHTKTTAFLFTRRRLLFLLPYAIYFCLVISNYWFNNFFTITFEQGYVRGLLYQLPYPVAFFYFLGIFLVAIKNRKETNRGIWFVLCLNMVVVGAITLVQFVYSNILLSGFANVTGLLLVYLYVQNVTKTIDQLTGLYNRDRLTFELTKHTKTTNFLHKHAHDKTFSLIVFSLRNMKGVNERFGLRNGNGLLENVGKYLKKSFLPYHVFRYNGDEFAVLIDSYEESLDSRILSVAKRFEQPFTTDEEKTDITLSIVYARVDFPDFGKDVRTLITAVDYSIASLKNRIAKSNYMYDISIFNSMSRRNKIIERIKDAVKNDGFEVYYQPIHSTKTKTFTGAEALIRIKNNEKDPIYPSEFIPLAEETGLIVAITYIVIEKVCIDLRHIIDTHGNDVDLNSISINFPYTQFLEHNMVKKVMDILNSYSISPKWIKIEITERALIDEAGLVGQLMAQMQAQGFIFELDDFGVDYSNMSMVLNLPVDIIKIDRSLVLSAGAEKSNEAFLELFIQALKQKNRILIVEGAERKEQVDFFERCECEYIQGFYYAKPLKIDNFIDFLLKNK